MIVSRKNTLDLFAEFDTLNLGTGDTLPSNAVALDDATGTFRNYILLRQFESLLEKTTGQITLTVTGLDISGSTIFTCSATYWIGSTRDWGDTPITTDTTWDSFNNGGTLNGLHDYLAGTITSGSALNFAKLTFAENEGYLNSNGLRLNFDLNLTNGVVDNVNTNDRSFNDLGYVKEWLNFPSKMDKFSNGTYLIAGYGTEQAYAGDLSFLVNDGVKQWTDRFTFQNYDLVTIQTQRGGKNEAFIDENNPNATNTEVYVGMNRRIYRYEITSFSDDFIPNIVNMVDLNPSLSSNAPLVFTPYPYYTNGVPFILVGSVNGDFIKVIENTSGNYSSPNMPLTIWGSNTIGSSGLWANKFNFSNYVVDSNGRVYFIFSGRLALDGSTSDGNGVGFRRMTLDISGTPTNPLDWSQEAIVKGVVDGGVDAIDISGITGTGDIANCRSYRGIVLDETDIVNGEPTIYVTCRTRHVILRIRHNGGTSGTAADWTIEHILGTDGVAGDVNGSGTTTQLNVPKYPYVEGDYVYIPCRSSHKVKRFNKTTLVLEDWKGGGAFGSNSAQTEGKTY